MFSLFSQYKTSTRTRSVFVSSVGFGLIELMVSIAIVTIVMAVVLARQSSFNDAVLLRSQAYEVALGMREVQLNAVSSMGFTTPSGELFRTTLGVHFDTSNAGTYRIFRDADGDNFYDGASEEFGLQHMLDSRFRVGAIRATGDSISGTGLSVVFQRPNFDARFFDSTGEVQATVVEIDITNPSTGEVRTIEITPTGQIAVLEL